MSSLNLSNYLRQNIDNGREVLYNLYKQDKENVQKFTTVFFDQAMKDKQQSRGLHQGFPVQYNFISTQFAPFFMGENGYTVKQVFIIEKDQAIFNIRMLARNLFPNEDDANKREAVKTFLNYKYLRKTKDLQKALENIDGFMRNDEVIQSGSKYNSLEKFLDEKIQKEKFLSKEEKVLKRVALDVAKINAQIYALELRIEQIPGLREAARKRIIDNNIPKLKEGLPIQKERLGDKGNKAKCDLLLADVLIIEKMVRNNQYPDLKDLDHPELEKLQIFMLPKAADVDNFKTRNTPESLHDKVTAIIADIALYRNLQAELEQKKFELNKLKPQEVAPIVPPVVPAQPIAPISPTVVNDKPEDQPPVMRIIITPPTTPVNSAPPSPVTPSTPEPTIEPPKQPIQQTPTEQPILVTPKPADTLPPKDEFKVSEKDEKDKPKLTLWVRFKNCMSSFWAKFCSCFKSRPKKESKLDNVS